MPIITPQSRATNVFLASQKAEDPLVAAYFRDYGPRTVEMDRAFATNLGLHAISPRELKDRLFSFSTGTALGLTLEEKLYEVDDPYVSGSPLRKAAAERLRDQGAGTVVFVESCGVAEFGTGLMNGFRITAAPFFQIGWSVAETASALHRYRFSRPVRNVSNSIHEFPYYAEQAFKLAPGTEFEVCGQGRLVANIGMGLIAGQTTAVASAGLGAAFGATGSKKDEISLTVLALPKPGCVRVILRKLDEESFAATARLRAGLVFLQGSTTGPLIGGFLRFYTEKLGAPHLEEFINFYTTLNLAFAFGYAHRGADIASFDFNLNDAGACRAYESLVYLNATDLHKELANESSAVCEVRVHESETETRFAVDLGLLGQKLFVYEELETARKGTCVDGCGTRLDYQSAHFTHRKKNFFSGTREIVWETINVEHNEDGVSAPYLHVRYSQKNWDFGENGVDNLLRLALLLGVSGEEMSGADCAAVRALKAHFARAAEVQHALDMFFTNQGIANISSSSFEEAKNAYLDASCTLRKSYSGFNWRTNAHSLRLIDEYLALSDFSASHFWEKLHHHHLYDDYRCLTGRDLKTDADIIKLANTFASVVDIKPQAHNPNEVAAFLRALCEHHPLEYGPCIVALARLAGPRNTKINNLSLSANGLKITNVSQGSVASPREQIAQVLHRSAVETT